MELKSQFLSMYATSLLKGGIKNNQINFKFTYRKIMHILHLCQMPNM